MSFDRLGSAPAPQSGQMNSRGHQGLLSLLTAPMVAEYTAAGWWGEETIYHLALRHARSTPDAFALRDRHRRLTSAEPGGNRDRAARLLAQRLCVLPVTAPRSPGRRGRRARRPHARRRADRRA